MKTILATAYAVNPYKGSEDGMGWNFVLEIAKFNKVIAITRENNQADIDKYMVENPNDIYQNIQFLYYDLPYWMRFWKKGSRGAMVYYLMWQYFMVSFVKKQSIHFDIVHNLNFHNDWSPSFLYKLGKPFVWGPIGHHPLIPSQYLKPYSIKYFLKDRLTWMVKKYFWNLSYSHRLCVKNASHILCMNSATPAVLQLKSKHSVSPSVASQDYGWQKNAQNVMFTIISAGRFVPLKGFDLTVLAFGKMVNTLPSHEKIKCQLILVGSGPEEKLLRKLVSDQNVEHLVQFIPWIERKELLAKFEQASVFLFPSHEGAGMVVPEALSFGLPVVCLDNEGPGQFITPACGFAVSQGDYKETVEKLGAALRTIYSNPILQLKMRIAARSRFENLFHWDRRGEQLQNIYSKL